MNIIVDKKDSPPRNVVEQHVNIAMVISKKSIKCFGNAHLCKQCRKLIFPKDTSVIIDETYAMCKTCSDIKV